MKKYLVWIFLSSLVLAIVLFKGDEMMEVIEENVTFSLDEIVPRDIALERNEYYSNNPTAIKIACIGNWSKYTASGVPLKEGIEMAVREINAAGGVNGLPIELIWYDDLGKIQKIQQFVENSITDETLWGIIGPITSEQVSVVKDRIAAAGLIQIAPNCQNDNISGDMLFKPIHSLDDESFAIYRWISTQFPNKNFVLLNEDNEFSNKMSGNLEQLSYNFVDIFHSRIVFSSYEKNKNLFNSLDSHHRYYPNDHYVFIGSAGSLNHAITQSHEFIHPKNDKILILNQEACDFQELETLKPKNFYTTCSLKKDKKLAKLLSRLDDTIKFKKSLLSVYAYRCIYLIKEGLEHAPDMKPETVAQYMSKNPLETPLGIFRFDESGFEDNPVIEILSFPELQDFWDDYIEDN